jgi:hypothetical protein
MTVSLRERFEPQPIGRPFSLAIARTSATPPVSDQQIHFRKRSHAASRRRPYDSLQPWV